MNIALLTSSYPAFPGDPSGTAGLFVREYALELVRQGHNVIIQPVARKKKYIADPGLIIEPIPWLGGDNELASLNLYNPNNWLIIKRFLTDGKKACLAIHKKYSIDRTMCMWLVPSGYFGKYIYSKTHRPFDIWALGSDIWKIKKIPFIGKYLIRNIAQNADQIYADGIELSSEVTAIIKRKCKFLPSCRKLPEHDSNLAPLLPTNKKHFLFVGRYHRNKGPDILLQAWKSLPIAERAQAHLHMFGLGPLETELRNFITDNQLSDSITFNGPIDAQSLSNMLNRIDYLVIPSRIESIPVIFSDALQKNTAIISTPVGDLTRLFEENSPGIIATEVSVSGLMDALQKGIATDAHSFLNAVKKTQEIFNMSKIATTTLRQSKAKK